METPKNLGESGKRLWESVTDEFDLDEHEAALLLQAARIADRLDQLDRIIHGETIGWIDDRGALVLNPALVESRQQSLALARLLASLRLPSGEEDGKLVRPQRRGAARGTYGIRGSVS